MNKAEPKNEPNAEAELKKAEADVEQAEAELKQAEADAEREAKRERRISYLKGKTPRCEECKKNRVTSAEDRLCYACQERAKTAELEAERKKPSKNWYIYWEPYNAFVCRECASDIAADNTGGKLEPAIVCCPNTYNCTRGIEFWGKDNAEPQHNLDLFKLDQAK